MWTFLMLRQAIGQFLPVQMMLLLQLRAPEILSVPWIILICSPQSSIILVLQNPPLQVLFAVELSRVAIQRLGTSQRRRGMFWTHSFQTTLQREYGEWRNSKRSVIR
uniref:Uncharacterized protein MANES_15G100900 n=1 Tax=Rhizophora mucronata TaxID=61149 RepID=A0A2P2P3Z1_RHIMU